ncbi:response regulator transcription factor [bacterium]|nr:response regulator transcription factor [bacterium]
MSRVLIVEDDHDIALSLRVALERDGIYEVDLAVDVNDGIAKAHASPPDIILLDLNLPGGDGLDICRALRNSPPLAAIPIIMVTARVDESARIAGLELGADDYVTKPFSVREVVARVGAVLRRTRRRTDDSPEEEVLTHGVIRVEPATRIVRVDGREIGLTRKEFDLLATLMRQRGRVLSRARLLERVWGYDHPGTTRTVDVHIRQLRRKLGETAAGYIETSVGVGYRFRGDS